MINTEYWDQRNQTIFSSIGHWQGGKDVTIEGYSLMNDLMGTISLMQLNILNATGKLVERNIADWVEVNFMGLSYPDSRIWCNQISTYAGDANTSIVGAASAAILSADSRAYGGSQTTYSGMQQLIDLYNYYNECLSLKSVLLKVKTKKNKPIIIGFARPIDKDDERLDAYIKAQKKLNIKQGKFILFALQLSEYLFEHFRLSINSGGYAAAFLLDQGFTPSEGYKIKSYSVVSGAVGCFRNIENSSPNSFLPMKCQDVEYIGVKKRTISE